MFMRLLYRMRSAENKVPFLDLSRQYCGIYEYAFDHPDIFGKIPADVKLVIFQKENLNYTRKTGNLLNQ